MRSTPPCLAARSHPIPSAASARLCSMRARSAEGSTSVISASPAAVATSRATSVCTCSHSSASRPPKRGLSSVMMGRIRSQPVERFRDHPRSTACDLFTHFSGRNLVFRKPFDPARVVRRRQNAARGVADVIEQDVVIFHASAFTGLVFTEPVLAEHDAFEDLNEMPHLNFEPGLLTHLTAQRIFEKLARLDRASRQRPVPLQRLVPALHKKNSIAVNDQRANPRHGTRRKAAIVSRDASACGHQYCTAPFTPIFTSIISFSVAIYSKFSSGPPNAQFSTRRLSTSVRMSFPSGE